MTEFKFELTATDGSARRGQLVTSAGTVETPTFMPVGTAATVRAMTSEAVSATGAEIVLSNTYHLMLRPGAERIAMLGGLHKFMNWPGPILTDSGGYQVMSLAKLRKLDEDGVTFRSHIDGSSHRLTPASTVELQHKLDATITMVLDECAPHPSTEAQIAKSMALSMQWARKSKDAFKPRDGYGLFGIVQGGIYPDQRHESALALVDIGFDGYAVGGLAVGEGQGVMFEVLEATVPLMPVERPRYLMGVGRPADLIGGVLRGIDMFDCVLPTRSGRTGQAFTRRGEINIRNARHAVDPRPLDEECGCPTCRGHSRAYLNHLVRSNEILGAMLMTLHNLYYYQDLMRGIRAAIEAGSFGSLTQRFAQDLEVGDIPAL